MTNTRPRGSAQPAASAPHPVLPRYYARADAKRSFLKHIFDDSAADYDRVDRLLAFGTGSWYRRQALLRAGLAPGMKVLDVAIGTGLVSRQIVRILGARGEVIGIDPSAGMLASAARGLGIGLMRGRAEALPFADASFDFLAFGFALRHVEDMQAAFGEFRRVLRPGGRLLALEITRPEGRIAQRLLRAYMHGVVPLLSRLVARHRDTPHLYRYYWETIESCVAPASVLAALESSGFRRAGRHVELGIFSEYCATA